MNDPSIANVRVNLPSSLHIMSRPPLQTVGEAAFARCDRVSAELLALTYGTFVRQLLLDYEQVQDVNKQLDNIGYNIGVRLVDDFLAKSKINYCHSFADTAEVIAKVAFKMFLGITAKVSSWSSDRNSFSLVFDNNPLAEFAELPPNCAQLWYSNIICGVIRGALEMVNMKVASTFVQCKLRGHQTNEINVSLHEILVEQVRSIIFFPSPVRCATRFISLTLQFSSHRKQKIRNLPFYSFTKHPSSLKYIPNQTSPCVLHQQSVFVHRFTQLSCPSHLK